MKHISEIFAEHGGVEGFLKYVESPQFDQDEREREAEVMEQAKLRRAEKEKRT